jgi:hypothetical protein
LNALVRARLCELLAKAAGVRDTGPYFMTGLFSRAERRPQLRPVAFFGFVRHEHKGARRY